MLIMVVLLLSPVPRSIAFTHFLKGLTLVGSDGLLWFLEFAQSELLGRSKDLHHGIGYLSSCREFHGFDVSVIGSLQVPL
jgi:hypothetical protein